jgi:hypothetical protein
MNSKSFIITCALLTASVVVSAQAPMVTAKKTLHDAFGGAIEVTDVVDYNDALPAAKFWPLFKPSYKLDKAINPWTNPVVRNYFFGRYWTNEGPANPIKGADELLALPHASGLLGKEIDAARPLIIADDIPFHPIMRRWVQYSSRYYPRRMHDWIVGNLQPAYLLTGKDVYKDRIHEMLGFLLYSQYQPDGHNKFVKEFYPDDYNKLIQNGNAKNWRGGWDYLFDWEWKDGYSYQWSLHEPDHHVGSNIALAMLEGWQMNGNAAYFKAADEFFTYQLPQYGFHSGVWNGHKYYWTQYDRSGSPKSGTSATDNIQALVARTAAMLGYYKKDLALLEYARGLLWYIVREYKTDGRWYYDSAENPMNPRRYKSHDSVVLNDALSALAYLLKAGVPIDEFMEPYGRAMIWYRENYDKLIPEKNFQAWKTFLGDNTVIYLQATTSELSNLSLGNDKAPVSVSKVIATTDGWKDEPAKLTGILKPGEILKLKFAGVDTISTKVSANILSYGVVTKATKVLLPQLLINADNFPSFPAMVHFPDSRSK